MPQFDHRLEAYATVRSQAGSLCHIESSIGNLFQNLAINWRTPAIDFPLGSESLTPS